ncbi:MAG: flagellin, partial [Dehalococcoidia bacterium]|nr:flagellin [Dehalococcoidia bacterium]
MLNRIWKALKDQRGITGLETAIILIAFVVVAAVFAYTALSAGIFSAQKGSETIYGGLKQAAGSMQLKGNIIAKDTDADNKINQIIFVVSTGAGGEAIDLTVPTDAGGDGLADSGSTHKMIISYIDKNQQVNNLAWSKTKLGFGDSDDLLESGEEFQITVDLTAVEGGANPLIKDMEFTLELKPTQGGTMVITRTTPNYIDTV